MPSHHWTRSFTVESNDIEFLIALLLEKENPLNTETLARALIERRITQEASLVQERFKNTRFYNPSHSYEVGQRLAFPVMNYATAVIVDIRPGENPEHDPFKVIKVEFDSDDTPLAGTTREFAADLQTPHVLAEDSDAAGGSTGALSNNLSADEILETMGDDIIYTVENALEESDQLVQIGSQWFPLDILTEVNEGHLHLVEAVLDINEGGPMHTPQLLAEIGGLDGGKTELQEFSLNYAMSEDDRFDEVGPAGKVLWYLRRLEPKEVLNTPQILQYTSIDYDKSLLDDDLRALEAEIDDERSAVPQVTSSNTTQAVITLNYPHRRAGTLPLNNHLQGIFPSGQQTHRTYVKLIDGQDGDIYDGWVVRKDRYVFGLAPFYRKHQIPVGAYVHVQRGENRGEYIINYESYRPRTEWIRLIVPKNNQITFENHKRSIGADYDDLMILGVDDLAGLDALQQFYHDQKRPLATIMRALIPSLGKLTPQGTVHAKTLYSAVNAVRRCPPGPIFATLVANPDFQDLGGYYWKIADL